MLGDSNQMDYMNVDEIEEVSRIFGKGDDEDEFNFNLYQSEEGKD